MKMRKAVGFSIILGGALMTTAAYAQQPAKLSARAAMEVAATTNSRANTVSWVYVKYDPAKINLAEAEGVERCIELIPGIASVQLSVDAIQPLSMQEGIEYIQSADQVSQMLDIARDEVGISKVNAGEGLESPYTGKGVIVGVVDAGFDYSHAAFMDKDGELRISRVWEQNGTPNDTYSSPECFGYGIELNSAEAIKGAGGDIFGNSHGTHVAAIAAGSTVEQNPALSGMAPDAEIVLVSMGESSRDNVNISNAIAYIFNYAQSQGKPCVVNLSLGTHSGPHDGTSTFDTLADVLQGPGRLIVGSSGNDRAQRFHLSRTYGDNDLAPLSTFIKYLSKVSDPGEMEVWASPGMKFQVNLVVYNTSKKEVNTRVPIYPSTEALQTVELGRNVTGSMDVACETSALNNKEHILIKAALSSIRTQYAVALEIVPESAGQVDVWADNVYLGFQSLGIEGFEDPEEGGNIAEIGGTAKNILSVGAYTTRNEYVLFNQTESKSLKETVGDLCSFSSYGPTADGRQKPEVTAPGCYISSAVSNNDNSGTLQVSYVISGGDREYMYGYMQGTSMASPMVAGIVATWLQACPTLTPDELKKVVRESAKNDDFTKAGPSAGWGYGKMDALSGLRDVLSLNSLPTMNIDAEANAIFRCDANVAEAILLQNVDKASLQLYNSQGALVSEAEDYNLMAGNSLILSTEGLQQGIYILSLKTNVGQKTQKIIIR